VSFFCSEGRSRLAETRDDKSRQSAAVQRKILLLSNVFPPQTGGSGRWLCEMYRRFPRGQVVVAAGECPRAADFDRVSDLDIVRLPMDFGTWGMARPRSLMKYLGVMQAVRRLVKSRGVEELHCGSCVPTGWVAWMVSQVGGPPYVCYVHGEELHVAATSRELKWMTRHVLACARLVVANSRNTARILADDWPVPPERLRILHPGVDASAFVPAARDEVARQALGWQGRAVVLTVGRLQKRKGHDMLIRAVPQITARVPEVLYAIVGDGEEREGLRSLAVQLGVADRVQFLGEPSDELLIRCYQQCDLFVLPNRDVNGDFEGFGMVLVEAQSCGKPVVAGASGGTAETMNVGHTGYVVPCEQPGPLAELLCELLPDRARLERMGEAGRPWVLQQFNWPTLVEQAQSMFAGSDGAVWRPFARVASRWR
jgi:phosphatidylinositol alpha-1,6-mannosyltransferase